MEESNEQKIIENFARPVIAGGISYVLASQMMNNYDIALLPFFPDISNNFMFGLLGAGSVLVSETIGNWILPYISHKSAQVEKSEEFLLSPAISAAIFQGFVMLNIPQLYDLVSFKPSMIGAGADILSKYCYDIVSNYMA